MATAPQNLATGDGHPAAEGDRATVDANSSAESHKQRLEMEGRAGAIRGRVDVLDNGRAKKVGELRVFLEQPNATESTPRKARPGSASTVSFSNSRKLEIFRGLFRGREDVYPTRWENDKTGKSGYTPECSNKFAEGVCNIKQVKCGACRNQNFRPVDDQAYLRHLRGKHVMGVYPLLFDNTCWFLAIDFDEESWKQDVMVVRDTCRDFGLPAYIERSRSGKGAHLWLFFSSPVSARQARALGSCMLTQAMNARPELSFRSYDRLFPTQDTMPEGGFGNLIALPLQAAARVNSNSVFLDESMEPLPHEEQWHVLARVSRISPETVPLVVQRASRDGAELGVHRKELVSDEDADAPWARSPSGRLPTGPIAGILPKIIHLTLAQQVFVAREGVPSALLNQLKRLAAFHNPEYYRKRSARRSTWNTPPRIICCAQNSAEHLSLPRGCLADVQKLARGKGIELDICDKRQEGAVLDVAFRGTLNPTQQRAIEKLIESDIGVLVAPPGSGKTVMAAALIGARKRTTLVLVHRLPILEQWRNQLAAFLKIDTEEVGRIGAGKHEPNGQLDVAMFQSMIRSNSVDDIVAQYGQVIVDECHHVAAVSFEAVLSEVRARYVTGLTATPQRRDRHHPIVAMQLGPVRYEVSATDQAAQHTFSHNLVIRDTEYRLPVSDAEVGMSTLRKRLANDARRNELILADVIATINEGRSPLVLTERRDHVALLAERLERHARNLFVLSGRMNEQDRRQLHDRLSALSSAQPRIVVATGAFIGEGFDDGCLDTLFLTLPISWKGLMVQYVGRLHRLHAGKREVRVFDYVDGQVPVLQRMFEKRRKGYRSMGYSQTQLPLEFELCADPDYVLEHDWTIPNDEDPADDDAKFPS